jgi:hypothetical protein
VLGAGGLPGEGDVHDDEQSVVVSECKLCGEGKAKTCCLPCGCLCMCHICAGRWRQKDVTGLRPFCMRPLPGARLEVFAGAEHRGGRGGLEQEGWTAHCQGFDLQH